MCRASKDSGRAKIEARADPVLDMCDITYNRQLNGQLNVLDVHNMVYRDYLQYFAFSAFFDYFAWLPRKMVRIGIIGALSDTHFCILSRDCFNLSREYFSLWTIKTSLDRNASAVLDPEMLFSRVARHLACLAFCKLQVGIF